MGKTISDIDVSTLADALKRLPSVQHISSTFTSPALKLLDCILSLERKYYGFVVPRLKIFQSKYPNINMLNELFAFIAGSGGSEAFLKNELSYDDKDRALTLHLALFYFIEVIKIVEGAGEIDKLYNWAISVKPEDYRTMLKSKDSGSINVPGFGLAGWQYARMLFGADTCKPDRYIVSFISDCLGKQVTKFESIDLLEKAAPLSGMTVRNADKRIWAVSEGKKKKVYHK